MRTKKSRRYWSQFLVWSTLGALLLTAIVGIVTVFFVYCSSMDKGSSIPDGPLGFMQR